MRLPKPVEPESEPGLAEQLGVEFGYLTLVFAGLAIVLDVCGSRWGSIAARALAAVYAFACAYYLRPARRRR